MHWQTLVIASNKTHRHFQTARTLITSLKARYLTVSHLQHQIQVKYGKAYH